MTQRARRIIVAGALIIFISAAVYSSGCTDTQTKANITVSSSITSISPDNSLNDMDKELKFMREMIGELQKHGKDITELLEIYRVAKAQIKINDISGFKDSLDEFYKLCNLLKVKVENISPNSIQ